MNKFYLFFAVVVVIVFATLISGVFYFNHKTISPTACTKEARLCPDGSYVSRQGANCEFAQCPEARAAEAGTIKGKVSVGPICPVERIGMPCPVPPEAYTSREVALYYSDGVTLFKRIHFLADGTYSFQVPPGTYIVNIPNQGFGSSSRDLPKTVTVTSGQTIEVNFSIDTGIR